MPWKVNSNFRLRMHFVPISFSKKDNPTQLHLTDSIYLSFCFILAYHWSMYIRGCTGLTGERGTDITLYVNTRYHEGEPSLFWAYPNLHLITYKNTQLILLVVFARKRCERAPWVFLTSANRLMLFSSTQTLWKCCFNHEINNTIQCFHNITKSPYSIP